MAKTRKTNNNGNGFNNSKSGDVKPPSAPEIEASAFGAMMIEKEAVPKALEMLSPESFYAKAHRIIFEAMISFLIPMSQSILLLFTKN